MDKDLEKRIADGLAPKLPAPDRSDFLFRLRALMMPLKNNNTKMKERIRITTPAPLSLLPESSVYVGYILHIIIS